MSSAPTLPFPPAARGSRRRRLWELPSHAHCPVVGVCLPIAVLRRLIDKSLGGQAIADDYGLHCGAIAECTRRTPIAECLQRELDRRYACALRHSAQAKSVEALAQWWQAGQQGPDVAGALWATLTHPRCDPGLEQTVLHDIHMLQHQVGASQRADLQRLAALMEENGVLARELATVQQRSTRLVNDKSLRLERVQAQLMTLRAELIGRDTTIAALRDELRALEEAVPGLKSRFELARRNELQLERQHQLERQLLQAQQLAECERERADAAEETLRRRDAALPAAPIEHVVRLHARSVLCVGGRTASVPVYRQAIEQVGGRFLHHDGGDEDSVVKLDASLSAADLVICQTGCISHDAYWRVKDHCKRTGKRCVFVDNPSGVSLQRALGSLTDATA
jgi:hypothetical protein